MKNVREITHNAIIYQYPDGAADVICADHPIFREPGWELVDDVHKVPLAKRQKGVKSDGDNMLRSMRRARANLRRLALANGFSHFVTLTLDASKIDRYDGAAITKALGVWADNMVRRHGLRYILVPERHKDGAFHFHGFVAGDSLQFVDSGHEIGGRKAYNWPQWKLGFTTAQPLYGEYAAAVAYCCKYIGKQEGQRPLGRWYFSGGALAQPEKVYVDMDFTDVENPVEFSIPGAKLRISRKKGGKL